MKKLLVCSLAIVMVAGFAYGQVAGTDHDLGSGGTSGVTATNTDWVCVFCHTPHQAAAANSQYPLWNHTINATTYATYNSSTMDAADAGTAIDATVVGSVPTSGLCMSCHDGTIGVGSLYNDPYSGAPDNAASTVAGTSNLGNDLTDDHPVNFTYNATTATNDGELVTPDSSMWVDTAAQDVPLFGWTVQCSSCHDPHDNTNQPFLTKSNASSGLCTTCHQK